MNEVVRLLLMLALAGTGVTVAGSVAIWFLDEDRKIRRALKRSRVAWRSIHIT